MNKTTGIDLHIKKLILRSVCLLTTFVLYLVNETLFLQVVNFDVSIKFGLKVYRIIWLLLIIEMVFVLVPSLNRYVSCGKCFEHHHLPEKHYNESHLNKYTKLYNERALFTFILWMIFIIVLAILYGVNLIPPMYIYLFVVFLYFADHFFITIWCPFKAFLVKNKCCSSCRIYNWGHAMMFSPLIVIPSFWTYSLLLLAIVIMIYWEFSINRYPERFSEISNKKLQCSYCELKCHKN